MLHEALKIYLDAVEQAVLGCDGVYVERYTEEILTPERVNLRLRLRFDKGYLLEIHEAVIIDNQSLVYLDYRYHCRMSKTAWCFVMTAHRIFRIWRAFRIINIYPMQLSFPKDRKSGMYCRKF